MIDEKIKVTEFKEETTGKTLVKAEITTQSVYAIDTELLNPITRITCEARAKRELIYFLLDEMKETQEFKSIASKWANENGFYIAKPKLEWKGRL